MKIEEEEKILIIVMYVQSDFFRMHMQVWMYCCNEYDLKENFFSEYGNFKFNQAF